MVNEAFIGEIRMFAGDYAPRGWAICNGQKLRIDDFQDLHKVIGTTFGGDGANSFALPDLRGRVPLHMNEIGPGPFHALGQTGGSEQVTLTTHQLPSHTHKVQAVSSAGNQQSPSGNLWARAVAQWNATAQPNARLAEDAIGLTGPAQPEAHDNMMPYLPVTFIIATEGIVPDGSGQVDAYVGEIRIFAFAKAPDGWERCDGQRLTRNQAMALSTILEGKFGGDRQETFALPDLRGRVAVHVTSVGRTGGEEAHQLMPAEIPAHTHTVTASAAKGNSRVPSDTYWAELPGKQAFSNAAPDTNLGQYVLANAGSSEPHPNMQPYIALNFCISIGGIYPMESGGPGLDSFFGEIRLFAGERLPGGWALCDGASLDINHNVALQAVIHNMYGGGGSTFCLPDLAGRVAIGQGEGAGLTARPIGKPGGSSMVTLTKNQVPAHRHAAMATSVSGSVASVGGIWGMAAGKAYSQELPQKTMSPAAIESAGGGQPHNNMQPYLGLHYIICTLGYFADRAE